MRYSGLSLLVLDIAFTCKFVFARVTLRSNIRLFVLDVALVVPSVKCARESVSGIEILEEKSTFDKSSAENAS
jgi:hypothetical protein